MVVSVDPAVLLVDVKGDGAAAEVSFFSLVAVDVPSGLGAVADNGG